MTVFFALIRKNLLDVRWMLVLICTALFWFCWLFVFSAHIRERLGRFEFDMPSIQIEMGIWDNNPLILLLLGLWGISRGSVASGEIEKGSLDLIMSRPVSRGMYLLTQVFVSVLGFFAIVGCMVAGNVWSSQFNVMRNPHPPQMLLQPAINIAAYGWAIYGYTFLLSSFDIVRWRPIMIASTATLAAYMAHMFANAPFFPEGWKWIDKLSIFSACRLREVVTTGESFAFNASILGVIGLVGVLVGFALFSQRDLPAGS